MANQLNIKDAETIAMARQLAKARNTTVTGVIKAALEREVREREQARADKLARIDEIVAEFQRTMPPEWIGKTSKELMDAIYDENGLPI
jgi:antitoxin VapB